MGKPEKSFKYLELGSLLARWRKKRYKSVLSMFKNQKFSISYSMYAEYERGSLLPSIETLLEMVSFMGGDVQKAVLVWCRVQLPSDIKKFLKVPFSHEETQEEQEATQPAVSQQIESPTFENTWTLGKNDRDILLKQPWQWDFLTYLCMVYPNEASWEELQLEDSNKRDTFIEHNLSHWIQEGRIITSDTGLRLKDPHIHMPKTEEWHQVRLGNLSRAVEGMTPHLTFESLNKNTAFRGIWNRSLTEAQLQLWVQRLKLLEQDFFSMPYIKKLDGPDAKTYTSLVVFGVRRLNLGKKGGSHNSESS